MKTYFTMASKNLCWYLEDSVPVLADLEFEELLRNRTRVLGKGSFGEVSLVRYFGMNAALKTLSDHEEDNLMEETKILRNLEGAGGAPMLLAVGDGDRRAYVSTYRPGETLFKAMTQTIFPDYYYLEICLQICCRVEQIHSCGYVHNDLHLGNILMEIPRNMDVPEVSVIDFGLACRIGDPAPEDLMPQYWRAPEVWYRDPCTPLSDVFTLSHLLRKILKCREKHTFKTTGAYPLDVSEVLAQGGSENPEDRPDITSFISVLKKALQTEREEMEEGLSASHVPSVSCRRKIRIKVLNGWNKLKKLFV